MKITRIIVLFALFTLALNAQEKEVDCDFNINRAYYHLEGNEFFEKNKKKAIEYLTPCIETQNPVALLMMGRILLEESNENSLQKAFKLIKASAKQNNSIAATDLGILYKYGKGCQLNYNKARKWFEKGFELGNTKAAYLLGYLYLKGFGNIEQDYTKAVEWFEKSDYPMAKYWLGVCYYYGYGVEKNTTIANNLFNTQSPTINLANKDEITKTSNISTEEIKEISNNLKTFRLAEITNEQLNGIWEGDLLFFDWSGTKIQNRAPYKVFFKHNKESNVVNMTSSILNEEQNVDFIKLDNSLYYKNFNAKLPHISFNKNIPSILEHQLLSSDISIKQLNTETYLTGNIETYVESWNETGVPIRFVLKKRKTIENSEKELSDEALTSLSEQEDNFIKLYPNPFERDLIVSYTLEEPEKTKVTITDINGVYKKTIKPLKLQKPGSYQYYIDGEGLTKGGYIITVILGNERKTRITIKK